MARLQHRTHVADSTGVRRRATLIAAALAAVLMPLALPQAGAAFADTSAGGTSSLTADVLDAPTSMTATRTCTAGTAALRAVSTATGSGTTLSVPRPAGAEPGDVLVGYVGHAATGVALAADPGDGWFPRQTYSFSAGTRWVGAKEVTDTEPTSYTFTGLTDGQATAAVLVAYRGVNWAVPSLNGRAGTGTAMAASGETVVAGGVYGLAFVALDATTVGPPALTGWAERANVTAPGTPSVTVLAGDLLPVADVSTGTVSAPRDPTGAWYGLSLKLAPGFASSSVDLAWTPSADTYATGYEGYRSDVSSYVMSDGPRELASFTDTTAPVGEVTYTLRSTAWAWRSAGVSAVAPACG